MNQSFTVTTLTVQTITFGPLSSQVPGTTPPALSATASSGLTVAFTSTTTSVCTVSGTSVTLVAVGTCSITANQAGNGTYAAASAATQSFSVGTSCATSLREYIRLGSRVVAIENSCGS